jgi:hypothetical protein
MSIKLKDEMVEEMVALSEIAVKQAIITLTEIAKEGTEEQRVRASDILLCIFSRPVKMP